MGLILPLYSTMTDAEFGKELALQMPAVQRLCLKFIKNNDDAEDLAGHVLARAWEKRDKYIDKGNMGGWLARITHNEFVTQYRKASKHTICSIDELYESAGDAVESNIIPREETANDYLQECAQKGITFLELYKRKSKVNGLHTQLLNLRLEGYTYQEISELTGLPEGTVKVNLNRLRVKAREMMPEIYERRQKIKS
jgi:RNA polymerase sigma-70 factor (ECF subfamily)